MSFYSKFITWLESSQFDCFYKQYLGIECPGCGMQRAFIELLKGNIIESVKFYPALIPILGMLIFLLIHLKFKFKKGATVLIIMFIFTTSIIVFNYIIKFL